MALGWDFWAADRASQTAWSTVQPGAIDCAAFNGPRGTAQQQSQQKPTASRACRVDR